MSRKRNWSAQQIKTFKNLHALGKCDREICLTMGLSRTTIGHVRRDFKLPANQDPDYGVPLSADQAGLLRRLFDEGKTDKEIARALDVLPGVIYRQRRKFGLCRKVVAFQPDVSSIEAQIDKEEREEAAFWRRAQTASEAYLDVLRAEYSMPVSYVADLGRAVPRMYFANYSAMGSPAAMCAAE